MPLTADGAANADCPEKLIKPAIRRLSTYRSVVGQFARAEEHFDGLPTIQPSGLFRRPVQCGIEPRWSTASRAGVAALDASGAARMSEPRHGTIITFYRRSASYRTDRVTGFLRAGLARQ